MVFGVFTHRQVGYWHDPESFFRRTVALTQDNYVAHSGLGKLLYQQGKYDEALEQVRIVLGIHPDDVGANMVLGDVEYNRGNLAAAIERYRVVTSHATDPDFALEPMTISDSPIARWAADGGEEDLRNLIAGPSPTHHSSSCNWV